MAPDHETNAPTANRRALTAAAEQVELLGRLRTFAEWAGTGRKLTATGNLTMAAGKELISLLGTDDRIDERIGDRVFKTRSTVELPGVDYTFRLARRSGFVKIRNGTVSATRRGTQLGRETLADWHAAFHGLLDLGVLQYRYAHATVINPYWKELVDRQVAGLLSYLLAAGRPVPIPDLQAMLWELVEASFVLDDLTEEQLGRHRDFLDGDVRRIFRVFADLGAVEVTDVKFSEVYGYQRETGGRAVLTTLGAAGVHELARR